MLINEYLRTRQISVTTGNPDIGSKKAENNGSELSFADILKQKTEQNAQPSGVEFSKHALERIDDRNIDLSENDMLDRLNKAVEIAQRKGSDDTLVLVDETAFLVSVRNNKVITTMNADDMKGNIFTNIDSTVIM